MECAAKGLGGEPCAGGPSRRCGSCGAVAYCSDSHQILHWSVHKDECPRLEKQMSRADVLCQFPFTFAAEITTLEDMSPDAKCFFFTSMGIHQTGLWKSECSCRPAAAFVSDSRMTDEWNLGSSLCPCTEPENPISASLTSWKDYYEWRSLPLHSPVAILLHWPLTLYHCVQLSRLQSSISDGRGTLCIHYLGPEKELLQLAVFGELRALFPDVQLQIELVGPAIPEFRDGETVSISSYAYCSEESCSCKTSICAAEEQSNRSTVTLKLRKGFYHDRYNDVVKDSYPHLVVAPNAGVAAYPSWIPTIELIKEMGVPAIFTDFCEEAAYLASRCISSVTGQPLRLPIQVNPFRQPMLVENSALYLPCYSNCFIFGI